MRTIHTNIAERDANVVAKFVVSLVRGKMWLPDDVDLQAVDWDELPTGAVHFANSRRSGAT
jgi:hypothetical protein